MDDSSLFLTKPFHLGPDTALLPPAIKAQHPVQDHGVSLYIRPLLHPNIRFLESNSSFNIEYTPTQASDLERRFPENDS